MSDTTPKGIKITDFPVASQVAPDDFIPILDSSTGIMQRTTTNHAATNDSWGPGTETEYGHNKTIDNFTTDTYRPGESLSAHAAYEFSKNLGSVEITDNAKSAHAKNDYFVFKGQLVRAITAIVKNDRIQLGTNIVIANISDSLKGLNSDVTTLQQKVNSQIGDHILQLDVVVRDGQYGYINNSGEFVDFKSQADIDAAVAAAMQGDAAQGDVLAGKTFTNASTSGLTGTMPNNGKVTPAGLNAGGSYTIPAGYHNGQGVVTANSLASQTAATAGAGDILKDKTAWVAGSKLTGTMPNNGAIDPPALAAGSSYAIPKGYHNGAGGVSAKDLASQTGVDSGKTAVTAGTMVSGYQGWVNGTKISGTFAGQTKSVIGSRSAQTVTPDPGKYLTSVTVNKFPDATGDYTCTYNTGDAASNDMGADNNYRRVNATNVAKCGAVNRVALATYLGKASENGKTFSVTGYSNYKQFTVNNFYYVIEGVKCNIGYGYTQTDSIAGPYYNIYCQGVVGGGSGNLYPSISYDNSTGVLTVNNIVFSYAQNIQAVLKDNTGELATKSNGTTTITVTLTLLIYVLPYSI